MDNFKEIIEKLILIENKELEIREISNELNIKTKKNSGILEATRISEMLANYNVEYINSFFIELVEVRPMVSVNVLNRNYLYKINSHRISKGVYLIKEEEFLSKELTEKCINTLANVDKTKLKSIFIESARSLDVMNFKFLIDNYPEVFERVSVPELIKFINIGSKYGEFEGQQSIVNMTVQKIKKGNIGKISKIDKNQLESFFKIYKDNDLYNKILMLSKLS